MPWDVVHGGGHQSKAMRTNRSRNCLACFGAEKNKYIHLYILSLTKKPHAQKKGHLNFHAALRFLPHEASTVGKAAPVLPKCPSF